VAARHFCLGVEVMGVEFAPFKLLANYDITNYNASAVKLERKAQTDPKDAQVKSTETKQQ